MNCSPVSADPADNSADEADLSATLAAAIKTQFEVTSPVVIRTVDPDRSPPAEFALVDRHLYW